MPQTFTVGARSRFVTLVALLFLALGIAGMAAGLVEQATQRAWTAALALGGADPALPAATRWMARELPAILASGIALCGALAVVSVGLLQRLEWARRLFIGLLALTLVVALGGSWLQQVFLQSMVDAAHRQGPMPAAAAGLFDGLATAARWLAGAVSVAVALGMAEIMRRLMSPAVRQEFA